MIPVSNTTRRTDGEGKSERNGAVLGFLSVKQGCFI